MSEEEITVEDLFNLHKSGEMILRLKVICINQTPRLTLINHNAQAVFMTLNKKDGGKKGRLQSTHKDGWKRKLKQRFTSD